MMARDMVVLTLVSLMYMKEGAIVYSKILTLTLPVEDRTVDIDVLNINNTDVWVQEISGTGLVQTAWTKPMLNGQNIIYNSLALSERNIFEVQTRLNDQIRIPL